MKDTIKDRVEALLKREDQVGLLCRNYDNFLLLFYVKEYHGHLYITLTSNTSIKDLTLWAKHLPALSEMKRYRAYFQNVKGLYPAELKIQEARQDQEQVKREEFRK